MTQYITYQGRPLLFCPNCGQQTERLLTIRYAGKPPVAGCELCSRGVIEKFRHPKKESVLEILDKLK